MKASPGGNVVNLSTIVLHCNTVIQKQNRRTVYQISKIFVILSERKRVEGSSQFKLVQYANRCEGPSTASAPAASISLRMTGAFEFRTALRRFKRTAPAIFRNPCHPERAKRVEGPSQLELVQYANRCEGPSTASAPAAPIPLRCAPAGAMQASNRPQGGSWRGVMTGAFEFRTALRRFKRTTLPNHQKTMSS